MMKQKYFYPIFIIALLAVTAFSCSSDDTVTPNQDGQNQEKDTVVPQVKTADVKNISIYSAVIGGKVLKDGGAEITKGGICWDTLPNPTIEDHAKLVSNLSESEAFIYKLSGLKDSTKYYVRAFAENSEGLAYGEEVSFSTFKYRLHSKYLERVWVDSTSFQNYQVFDKKWDYLYPWGSDHNGTARMVGSKTNHEHIYLNDGILTIEANRLHKDVGKSSADPHLKIKYYSGTIHLHKKIVINNENPYWIISGDFNAPTSPGTWPAFWITGAETWPPESDIMEFKGTNTVWQNTVTGPDWQHTHWQNELTEVQNPDQWHNYKVIIEKTSSTDVKLTYFIDDEEKAIHTANFVDKPFDLIINLQMGGSSQGTSNLEKVIYRAKNVSVSSWPNSCKN